MDVGGTVMGKEVGGRTKRSARHPEDRESQPSLFMFFATRKKKITLNRKAAVQS